MPFPIFAMLLKALASQVQAQRVQAGPWPQVVLQRLARVAEPWAPWALVVVPWLRRAQAE